LAGHPEENNTHPENRPLENHVPWKTPVCVGIPRRRVQILPKHLESGSELRNLLEAAIEKDPIARPILVKGEAVRNR
jgi:hypothetical protein